MPPTATATADDMSVAPTPTFADLGVPTEIADALHRRGITAPFEIQAATISDALAGRDVCGRAPTGSGKTLAFGIPLVATVERAKPKQPTALILAPTRELADQIHTELRTFAGNVRVGVVYGGVGYGPQLKALRQGVDILVACPGRLEDLIEQGVVSLHDVAQVVLDEADRMADMGFMPAVRRILDQTLGDRQTVLFSATLDGDVAKLTRDYQRDPVRHEVGDATPDITAASHVFWTMARPDRVDVTAEAVNAVWPAIIFCRTRHGSDRLAKQLGQRGIRCAAIHGGRSQGQRTRALADFSKGKVHALVATDVAARGIHVDGVAAVIHFDPPEDHKTYVHRSGRTARAGDGGVVVSMLLGEQERDARRMQRKLDLDEPIAAPDAAALRALSPTPTPRPVPTEPVVEPEQQRGSKGKSRGGSRRGNQHRGHGGQNRSGGKSGKPKSKERSSSTSKKKPGNRSTKNKSQAGRSDAKAGGSKPNRKARRAHLQPGDR